MHNSVTDAAGQSPSLAVGRAGSGYKNYRKAQSCLILSKDQVSILPGLVKWVPAYMSRFEAAARCAYICFRSARGNLVWKRRYINAPLFHFTLCGWRECVLEDSAEIENVVQIENAIPFKRVWTEKVGFLKRWSVHPRTFSMKWSVPFFISIGRTGKMETTLKSCPFL